jgi:hypothetical protein
MKSAADNSSTTRLSGAHTVATTQYAEMGATKAEGFPNEVVVYYNPVDANESYLVLTSGGLCAVLAASCVGVMMGLLFLLLFAQ